MAGVFLSYARRDAADFVEGLARALVARGREAWVDSQELVGGTRWREAIVEAIDAADTFVFVLTPGSAASSVCRQELAHATAQGKRIVWIRRHEDSTSVPEELRGIHWVSFCDGDDPEHALDELLRALDDDRDWEVQKAALLQRERTWQLASADASFLLRARELDAALAWLGAATDRPGRVPGTPARAYIEASQAGQARELARLQELHARASGRELAAQAEIVRGQGPAMLERSVLLAIEAMRRSPSLEADHALRAGLVLLPRVLRYQRYPRPALAVAFSPDGSLLAAGGRDGFVDLCPVAAGDGRRLSVGAEVVGLEFRPDGTELATASGDGVITIWDLRSGKVRARLGGGRGLVCVRWSADGAALASASWDGTAIVRDASSGRELVRVEHERGVLHLAFSPSGASLATASQDGTARVTMLSSGAECFRLVAPVRPGGQPTPFRRVVFTPDGARLAAAGGDGTVTVCDATTGAVYFRLAHATAVHALACSADGQWFATGEGHGAAIWVAATGRLHRRMPERALVWDVAFDRRGVTVATASHDGTARLWDCATGGELVRAIHEHAVHAVAVSPDGTQLASASGDQAYDQGLAHGLTPRPGYQGGSAGRWEARGGGVAAVLACDAEIGGFAATPDDRFAVVTRTGIELWSGLRTSDAIRIRDPRALDAVKFAPDRRRVAVGGGNGGRGVVAVLDAATGTSSFDRDALPAKVHALAWSPDGGHLAAALADGSAIVWDAVGDEVHREAPAHLRIRHVAWCGERLLGCGLEGVHVLGFGGVSAATLAEPGHVAALASSSNGRIVAAAAVDEQAVLLHDLEERRIIGRLGHGAEVLAMQFSADGARLATGDASGCARLWDVRGAGAPELACFRHDDQACQLAFSPDERHLGVACWDGTARIWSIASGREVARTAKATLGGHLAFSSDGRLLATSHARTVRFWWWQPSDLLADAASRVTRSLTIEEWRQYLPDEDYAPAAVPSPALRPMAEPAR